MLKLKYAKNIFGVNIIYVNSYVLYVRELSLDSGQINPATVTFGGDLGDEDRFARGVL